MNPTSLIEMAVVKLSPFIDAERPLLWLAEKNVEKPRLLPIAIRDFEAVAIQMVLENDSPARPLPQDLLFSMFEGLELTLQQVELKGGSDPYFTGELLVDTGGQTRRIDARPSDAIALALRAEAAIFARAELLDSAAFAVGDGEDIDQAIDRFGAPEAQILSQNDAAAADLVEEPPLAVPYPETGSDRLGELRSQLEKAVLCEEYEEAARLRDQISNLVAKTKP